MKKNKNKNNKNKNNDLPIYRALKDIQTYPFHMPGHKRNPKILNDFHKFIDLDFTEIDGTDNLFNPQEIIQQSMNITSKVFGSGKSYFLVNGSTSGILASILSQVQHGEHILVLKNCHISVHNAISLANANPIYINPIIKNNIVCGVNIADVELAIKTALSNNIKIKAFILTSPTYEGLVIDIKKISKLVKKYDIILIVDEAHGAHFNFSTNFPSTALHNGADIVIQSFHKTLPSFTQCAVLHISKKNNVNTNLLEKYLAVVQTTSPSYIFMLSLEYATNYVNNNFEKFQQYTKKLLLIRAELKNLNNLELIDKEFLKNSGAIDFDISRFTFIIKNKNKNKNQNININKNINGEYLNKQFLLNNIQLEMYSKNYIIAISTICDDLHQLENFKNIIIKIDKNLDIIKNNKKVKTNKKIKKIKKLKINKNKNLANTKLVSIDNAINQVSVDFIIPYPPGIPIILAGDIITPNTANKLKVLIENNINILGVVNKKIYIKN